MGHYKFDQYLKEKNDKCAVLIAPENCNFDHISAIINGTNLTRDLVNIPTCDMGPTELADASQELAKEYGAACDITVGDDLLEKGYETIHTVGRAAEKEPRLIDITWGDENDPKITLIGKGVCFDTGGLDIKPSSAMLTMKKDMGGAAHVLGLAQMIMEVGLKIRLRVLIPAVENNISANAFRPGDIIKSYEGTTIEVGNTDAEGRLVLCDAIALASEENPELMIDFATLTGAARVAMGVDVPPYFTDDEELNSKLLEIQHDHHDPLWPLPLYTPYRKMLSSSIADINNVGSSGFGGAITAALFLKHFVGKDIPWIHFDVYAWNASDRPGKPKGGEAMGIRAVFAYLSERFG
nr:leucyl aminopeptidase family protein [Pseudemcibacter aquimaris]